MALRRYVIIDSNVLALSSEEVSKKGWNVYLYQVFS